MKKLVDGVRHFHSDVFPQQKELYEQLSQGQHPRALVVTCADSRLDANAFTQSQPGELFFVRNAGNIVPPHGAPVGGEAATIEYGLKALGIRQIIVCGHSQCGAMGAIIDDPNKLDPVPYVKDWLAYAEPTRAIVEHKHKDLEGPERLNAAIEENVLVQMNNLSTHPFIAALLSAGELRIFGWVFDIPTGSVRAYNPANGKFEDLHGDDDAVNPLPIRQN